MINRTLSNILIVLIMAQAAISHAQFVQEKAIRDNESAIEEQYMQIEVFDGKTKEGIRADVLVKGLNSRNTVVLKDISDTTLLLKKYRLYTISCIKPGYMYYAHKFWPDETKIHVEAVKMQPLAIGQKADIQDITFLGDETQIYHKSGPALEELIKFLEVNPTVKICIIGHVNGVDSKKGDNFYKKASEKRAEAVMEYLINHGVDKERLTVRGAGSMEMIYPNPETDWQTEANRRVEIEVTGL